jgi:DNA-binding NtrC family response regulator
MEKIGPCGRLAAEIPLRFDLSTPESKKVIVVLDADQEQCRELCSMLEEKSYRTKSVHSIGYLGELLRINQVLAVIIDLDTVPVDNRTVRELALKNRGTCILALSRDRFHPHLRDAICYHIYACIKKPLDPDELFYWLKAIAKEGTD